MSLDDRPPSSPHSALERARLLSQALSDAARKTRISKRSRRALQTGGFAGRRGATLFRFFVRISFAVLVIIPTTLGAIYYGAIASDQYVAEAQFTVMGGVVPSSDGVEKLTGVPTMAIIQDTQIVTNYIHSRAAVEKLNRILNLKDRYSRSTIDVLSRFQADSPIENLVRYWKGKSATSISLPSGIVTLKVSAFSAKDSFEIANAILTISEDLINELNARMNGDAIRDAEQELEKAARRLASARTALEQARNNAGTLDVSQTAAGLNDLITQLKSSLLSLEKEYEADLRSVSPTAPQMKATQVRIQTTRAQIADLESQITSKDFGSGKPQEGSLAHSMTQFSELELEQQVANRLYTEAAGTLELTRIAAERKLMYISTFVRPVPPEEPRLPHRILYPTLILLGAIIAWGALVAITSAIRNNMA